MNIDWKIIPTNPGVYLWKNFEDKVIYVGKAKNLNNRMKQYFFGKKHSPKTMLLISEIKNYDFQITNSEIDALILEQTLINKFNPKYNIKIKSAKRYPYIEMIDNPILQLKKTNKIFKKNKSKYFGPFPDGYSANKIIRLLIDILPIDKCLELNLNKPCINYQMGKCLGYCFKRDLDEEKEKYKEIILNFFKGKTLEIESKIKEKIDIFNSSLKFEESKNYFEKLKLIKKLNENSIHQFDDSKHRDIINFYFKDGYISIIVSLIRFGNLGMKINFFEKIYDIDIKNVIENFIIDFYKENIIPDELIIPFENLEWENNLNIKITNPKIGKKKELLNNAFDQAKEKYQLNLIQHQTREMQLINAQNEIDKLKFNINIDNIAMIDVSSLMGDNQVGCVITSINGEFKKDFYRKFIIKSVDKMNDYESINEISMRYLKNLIENKIPFPSTIIVDGKHQINSVINNIKKLDLNIKIIGLKKDRYHKTDSIFFENKFEYKMDKMSDLYKYLSRIQDEVHRFTILFQKQRKNNEIFKSELDKYVFLTENDKKNLISSFGSIREIFIAKEIDIEKIIGKSKAKKLFINKSIM